MSDGLAVSLIGKTPHKAAKEALSVDKLMDQKQSSI